MFRREKKNAEWKKHIWEDNNIVYYVNGEKVEESFKAFFTKRPFYDIVRTNHKYVYLLVAFSAGFNENCLPNNLIVTTITPLAYKVLKPVFKWGFKHDLF